MRGGPVARGQVKELETSMDGGWVVVGGVKVALSSQGRGGGMDWWMGGWPP